MRLSSVFRRSLWLALPAVLAFSGCSDDTSTPAPDQGKVTFINGASHIPGATLKFQVDNAEKASLAYGASSTAQSIATGSRVIKVLSGTQTVLTQPAVTLDKDKNYTFVATPAATPASVGGQFIIDDLTAPATGKARIRVINLGQNLTNPIKLSQVTSTAGGPVVVDLVTSIASNQASAFTDVNPGTYGLSILDNNGVTKAEVGTGTGTGTGTKAYVAGKLYTIVVTGTADSADPAQALKAYLSQNN